MTTIETVDLGRTDTGHRPRATGRRGASARPRRRSRRLRRVLAMAMLGLAIVIGSITIGGPSADAAPRIDPPMTNCATNECAARAGEAAIRAFLGNQGTASGRETVGVVGCTRIGNRCIVRYFLVTVELENGEAILIDTRNPWTAVEDCGDIGGLD